jgi:hypothetical protein
MSNSIARKIKRSNSDALFIISRICLYLTESILSKKKEGSLYKTYPWRSESGGPEKQKLKI